MTLGITLEPASLTRSAGESAPAMIVLYENILARRFTLERGARPIGLERMHGREQSTIR